MTSCRSWRPWSAAGRGRSRAASRRRWGRVAAPGGPGTKPLLLEEPFEGVSPVLSRRLAEVIRSLQGVAVLVTESDANRMRLLTEQIYTIERGEIIQR